jgi:Ca-activated chloride channel family protein
MRFEMRTTASRANAMIVDEPQVFYVLVELLPDPALTEADATRDSRLNLTLVLDHSNSMSGTRLEKVKVAAHQIIDKLGPNDILSIVAFNDFAEVVIPAGPVVDKAALKARASMMLPGGGTEIFKGLSLGIEQNRTYLGPRLVNHVILLTDGNTYGDEEESINLARTVAADGMAISAMGLGQEWNDKFLDELSSTTGGSTAYITSANAVVKFLNERVRSLSNVFAERVQLIAAVDPDIRIESAFRLSPNPQPVSAKDGIILLGSLQIGRPISLLLQLEVPASQPAGKRTVARLVSAADVLNNRNQRMQRVDEVSLNFTENAVLDDPPSAILDAIAKLTLYTMQERAQEALEKGDVRLATRRLESLATRLMEMGELELAAQAQIEAQQVIYTHSLSDGARKSLKYQTRGLMMSALEETR